MNRFSAVEAALEGFRLTRERPGTVMAWSVIYLFCMLLLGAVMLASLGRPFIAYVKRGGLATGDAETVADMLAGSWPAFLLMIVLVVLFVSVLTAGTFRMVLRPYEGGFAHLRLGADELRLTACNLILYAIGVVMFVAAEAAVATANSAGGVGATVVASIVSFCVIVWIGVRLSLATPMTFALHRMSIRASWELTRHHFWSLLAMWLLMLIFYLLIWLLVALIVSALVAIAGGPVTLRDLHHFSPVEIVAGGITFIVQLILPMLLWLILYSPLAVAYQQLHGDLPARPIRARPQEV